MYLYQDRYGFYELRCNGRTYKVPAKTVQSAVIYIGQHLEKLVPQKGHAL